ncbi:hypothetical protein [Helicobacter apodemus]|uniref:hypothetical protein n=1 Tax=Helicobacter apodemus TaxID=135569 RepID=UPI0022AB489A|nr:hypothetical protein [Helicobacter apodemus]
MPLACITSIGFQSPAAKKEIPPITPIQACVAGSAISCAIKTFLFLLKKFFAPLWVFKNA